ncbi:MAG: FN3 associated domain-containing protein, partial [Opitutaceae bacterium]
DACRLLLVASLANVPNATLGLSLQETVSLLCQPGRDIARLPKDILGVLATRAWYLHSSRDGKLFFKNVENLNAKLKTRADTYNRESRLREMRQFLERIFAPTLKDCYQRVAALPALDEIQIDQDAVTLVIFEPHPSGGLHPDLQKFFADAAFKNRVLFLSGDRETMATLLETASELRAIDSIVKEMDAEKVSENDPQRVLASDLFDKIKLRLLSAARESFTKLHYPTEQGGKPALLVADFLMQWTGNDYNGEKQIRDALKSKMKWTDEIASDTFRRKCEDRLFTQQVMPFAEVKKRAAMSPRWQWHHPSALDDLLNRMLLEDKWRADGELIDKGPFAPPKSTVRVQELRRDSKTGEVVLKLTALHADTIHYEIGGTVTTASAKVDNPAAFPTRDLRVSFLAVDSTGQHARGDPEEWRNRIEVRHRFFLNGKQRHCELEAAPAAPIRYTCDGSDPKHGGGAYSGAFPVPKGTLCVLAVAEKDGILSGVQRFDVPAEGKEEEVKIDPFKPALWRRATRSDTTKESYELLERLKKHAATAPGIRVTIHGARWVELTTDDKLEIAPDKLEEALRPLREILGSGDVRLEASSLHFTSGQNLLDWVAEEKTTVQPGEVQQ